MLDPYLVLTLTVLGVIVYAVFQVYRKTQVERFRQQLYVVRDIMFDDAMFNERISRRDPAYQLMRDYVNSIIRFAHRFYLSDFAVLWYERRKNRRTFSDTPSIVALLESSRDRDYYLKVHKQINTLVLVHMVKVSPLIAAVVVGGALGAVTLAAFRVMFVRIFQRERESFSNDPTVVAAAQSQSLNDVTRFASEEGMALGH